MQKGYLLGVDIGTYSSKGVLVNQSGAVVASHTVPHSIEIPQPGFVEHDAEKTWWNDFVEITKNLLKRTGVKPQDVLAIGISGIGPCVLPVDENGNPLRPAILYGIDTRATKEIEYLEEILSEEKIFDVTGTHLSSQAIGPKILWIKRNEPEIYRKTRWFLTSQSYLVYKLTGKAAVDVYSAGGYAPLFNIFTHKWETEIAKDIIAPLKCLPEVFWSHEVVGGVTSKAAAETGLSVGTPVIAGTTDAAAEAISVGLSKIGDMMLMLGSSVFFIVRTAQIIRTQHFWSSNFVQENSSVLLGGMSTGGSLTTWFRDQFGQFELELEKRNGKNAYEALAELALESPKGSKGLIVLPYFAGERTPLHDPEAKGVFFGLTLSHTKADLYRAVLESIAYGIRHNMELIAEEGVRPKRILMAGGGLKNPLWTQLIADICKVRLSIPEQQIGASYGDALLAAIAIGLLKGIEDAAEWVKIRGTVEPDQSDSEIYEMKYNLFRELYINTKTLMGKVHSLQERLMRISKQ